MTTSLHDGSVDNWDWAYIASNLAPRERTLVQSGNLPERAFYKLVASSAVRKRSLSQQTQALLLVAIDQYWEQHWKKDIEFRAAQLGIPADQLFVQLINGKLESSVENTATEDTECLLSEPD
jgi:hypothetical protein